MKRRIALIAWLAASLIVLAWWGLKFGFNPDISRTLRNEAQIYLVAGMVALSFPAGIPYMYLFGVAARGLYAVGIDTSQHEIVEVLVLWGGFVLSGYLQWFLLLPYIREKLRDRRTMKMSDR